MTAILTSHFRTASLLAAREKRAGIWGGGRDTASLPVFDLGRFAEGPLFLGGRSALLADEIAGLLLGF